MAVAGIWETGWRDGVCRYPCAADRRGRRGRTSCASPVLLSRPWLESPPFPRFSACLALSSTLDTCVFFLSFISSKTEDWGYLNEDGELGLAYQGLKQVARWSTSLSACVCLVRSACCVYTCASWSGCQGMGTVVRVCGGGPSGNHLALVSRLFG